MSHDQHSNSCANICYALSAFSGIALSVGLSNAIPNIFAVIIGVGFGGLMAVFLQEKVCGLARDYWGPFEGLRAFVTDDPHDQAETHGATDTPSGQGSQS